MTSALLANVSDTQLCLSFANTVAWHASVHPQDGLSGYATLLAWARQQEVVDAQGLRKLMEVADREQARADAVMVRAVALREAIYRIFSARVHQRPCLETDLALLNKALPEALARVQVVSSGHSFSWGWSEVVSLERPLWPVARSAATLLTSEELLERVGECADDRGCGWLFLDLSKNRSRRWCDINDCGNRAKQRRHVQRRRSGPPPTDPQI